MAAACIESEENRATEAGAVVVAEVVPEADKVEGLLSWGKGIQPNRHAAVAGGDADVEGGDGAVASEDCAAAVAVDVVAAVGGRDGGCPALGAGTWM